jgi:uncharacterized membrane protein
MVVVALAMTALLSIVALAVDVGMLFTARGEAQRVADAAAGRRRSVLDCYDCSWADEVR